ncbi:protein kinase [uncultured Reyranella sp.]|uniref:serine/threonine protein kinase n=1 Tax=uncultured Reyranella sp. TaxID=735512 RepID=UPI00259CFC50|nr:protein kinase [uncultured Reyranella sp.]
MNEPTKIAGGTPPEPDADYVSLKAGQTIGRYEIVSVLGQGGFGITYRARDVQLGREVAIKEYLPSALAVRQDGSTVLPRTTKMADDFGWGRDRFVTEGRTLASLHRVPAIVQVFDFLEANGTAYIVMELLSGATLEDRINTGGRLKPEEVDRILWPLLDGLEQVHAAGFLHRDIKPANILLDANGNPTLIDFGASRAAMVGRTAAMTAIFTPGYAAAEQMTSAKQGPWTDIYGLAATIYHAIAGKAPPNAFDRMLDDGYEPLARIAPPGFSPGVLAGIDAGLTVAARDRPQSISGWRPILGMSAAPEAGATMVMARPEDAAAARVSVLGPATPTVSADALPSAAAPRSKAGLWVGIAAVVLLALGGGGYYAMATRGPDPEIVKARAAAEAAEEARRKADEEADKLRAEKAEQDAKVKAEQDAKAKAALEAKQKADAEAAKRQFEEDTRRKVEAEIAEKKRAADEAQRKADEEAAARQKAIDDARKATEFVAGNFDHFGKTLMLIGLKDRSGEIRLQGVDSVDDPALHKLAADALAAQPRNLRCRQTDRLTDGTPLYRCLITKRAAKEPLGEIPDSDRDDLALVLVRTGLLLASCDAPRSYADAEDDARGSKQYLWSRVTVPEYKRRCTR